MYSQQRLLALLAVSLTVVPSSAAALDAAPAGMGPDNAPAQDMKVQRLHDYPKPAESKGFYAYEAEAGQPGWAAAGGEARLLRDDDLRTTWSCAGHGDGARCAVALRFPSEAVVHMVRIAIVASPSASPKSKDTTGIPMRIHTGQGWLDVRLTRSLDHQHVLLEHGLTTRALVLELLPGAPDDAVGIAEVEIFGPSGPRRPALALDPRRVLIRTEGDFYRDRGNGYAETASTWLEQIVELQGPTRRLLRGSNLSMQPGDRLALVRRLGSANCPGAEVWENGDFLVLDTATRLMVRLASFAGHQHEYRRNDGMGVLVELTSPDGEQTVAKAYAVDRKGTASARLPPQSAMPADPSDLSQPERRRDGYADFPKSTTGACRAPTDAERARVRKTHALSAKDSERWALLCKDAAGYRLAVIGEQCDDVPWSVVSFDQGWRRRAGPRLTGDFAVVREIAGRLLVEVVQGDSAEVHVLEEDGKLRLLFRDAAFGIHTPATCRCNA